MTKASLISFTRVIAPRDNQATLLEIAYNLLKTISGTENDELENQIDFGTMR